MAATVSAWAKPGAWALDSEENEAELLQQHKDDSFSGHTNGVGGGDKADFPSLATATATATKTKKKKPQTLSLQEFTTYGAAMPSQSSSSAAAKGLTHDEMMALPTGPRQRSAEELDRTRLGGGFRYYGPSYDRPSRVSLDEQPRRSGSFGRDSNREFEPSRADEAEIWASMKKSVGGNAFERRDGGERGGFFSDSQSRANDSNHWASNKAFVPSESRRYEKRGGFGLETNGGADSDNWVKKKVEEGRKIAGSFDSLRERRGGFESNAADSETWGRKREEESGGRPRLNLKPRTLPVGEGQKTDSTNATKPKGNNPFGSARPREEVLKEKGQDWMDIKDKLESTKIKEVSAVSGDGLEPGKRSSWSGRGRERSLELRTERTWRKPESVDSRPQSGEKTENEPAEDGKDKDPHM